MSQSGLSKQAEAALCAGPLTPRLGLSDMLCYLSPFSFHHSVLSVHPLCLDWLILLFFFLLQL